MLGGGSPKNFILQTEPHIQEILNLNETGHDYFIQITDARPDTEDFPAQRRMGQLPGQDQSGFTSRYRGGVC